MDRVEITGILKTRRKELKLTLSDLSVKADAKKQYLSRVENGSNPTIDSLVSICAALDMVVVVKPK